MQRCSKFQPTKEWVNKVNLSSFELQNFFKFVLSKPRSQSSSAISDVTSPVKLVGKVRRGRLANNGKSKMAAPSQECDFSQDAWRNEKKASEIGWDSLINVCHQIHRDVGLFSFKESFRLYTCYYRRPIISSFDCTQHII